MYQQLTRPRTSKDITKLLHFPNMLKEQIMERYFSDSQGEEFYVVGYNNDSDYAMGFIYINGNFTGGVSARAMSSLERAGFEHDTNWEPCEVGFHVLANFMALLRC